MTEVARCYIHNVDEPYTPGVDYRACGECWHVWSTEAAFRVDVDQLYTEMEGTRVEDAPADLTKVYSCPLCAHDF